jgi:hypothetical protein
MQVIPAHLWNGSVGERFYFCQMSLTDPFGLGVTGTGFGYIFIERVSLNQFLLSQPFAQKPSGLDFHLSPYMQTMATVARKLEITPLNQPKKAEIIAELKMAWTGAERLGENLLEYMATILREPDSQLGRRRRK